MFIDDSGVEVSFLGHAEDNASRTTYTISATLSATANYIVAAITWDGLTAVETLTSVTIDGVSASIIDYTLDDRSGVALAIAQATGNATGNIVIVVSGTGAAGAAISTLGLTGWASASASSHTTSTASAPTANLSVNAGGAIIATASFRNVGSSATTTWTGLTERSDTGYDTVKTNTTAADSFSSANASLTVTATPSASNRHAGVFAVFNP